MDVPGELSLAPVETVDHDLLPAREARRTARLYYYVGFALLPWFWVCNIWLYWPSFIGRDPDPVVKRYTRRSAAWCAVYTCLFLPWFLVYIIGGAKVLGQSAYDKLSIFSIDLAGAGLGV